ncbi:retrograde transporter [Nannochloropsis gaditana CCMP526]|uniref:retrograde transporter n=1 Tax=Nannochloropsis gaditana (strain CCMP526) TaxID=1093141 RepID=UPI00029F7377|nr:retrograde transporter [Nannochloropsis gaditana CCMP526]EKU21093.1 retrograde transporter [Nannochloropsis gaditana CCMP526]|eukprot:XP_005855268.1 retrograde transporter [Nannochloropsis gaditana CCMP526]
MCSGPPRSSSPCSVPASFLGALDVLEDGQGLVREGGLATVRCTRRLARQLGEYMELVSDLLASSFIGLALSFQGGGHVSDPDACVPDTRSSLPSPSLLQSEHSCVRLPLQQPELDEALKAQLVPRVRGLVRLCRLSKALERYRGRLTASLKEVVKTVLTEYLGVAEYQRGEDKVGADGAVNTPAEAASPPLPVNGTSGLPTAAAAATSTEENAGLLGKGVRAMKAESFLGCLKLCFEQMLLPMTGVGLIHTFLEEQISEELSRILDRRPVPSSSLHSTHQSQGELSTGSPGETGGEGSFGHVNREPSLPPSSSPAVSNSSRTDAGSVPPSPTPSPSNKFKTFLEKRRLETGGGASKSGTSTVGSLGIGGKQQTQAPFKDEDQIKVLELQACKKLNDEILKTLCDLCYRHIVSLLVARREANVSMDLAEIKVLWDSTMSFLGAVEQISGTAGFGLKSTLLTQAKQFVEHVHKGGVGRLLAALDAESYLNVAANFPMLAMDVMQCVVNLLRLFNTRTAQLVLGAGAIQATARLRSITAKHLALASQCLGLILVLLPHVRAALAAHLQTKQQAFLIELDRLRQEYAEHQERVLTKFVAIMGELIAHSAANTGLRETDWDALGSAACRFVEEVIKGTTTMHRVLYQILPPTQVQDIFNRVFDLLGHRLKEYLDHARPTTNAGRERLVDEVSHLVTSLSMLRGVNAQALAELEGTIREKFSPASFLSSPATTSNSPSPTSLTLCLPPTDLNGGSASHEPILTPPRTSDAPASASSA